MWGRVRDWFRFDKDWYLATYPDVARSIERGLFKDARDHYRRFGRSEGRLPFNPDVEENWYLEVYPDVGEAIMQGQFESASDHYIKVGCKERRTPKPLHRVIRRVEE